MIDRIIPEIGGHTYGIVATGIEVVLPDQELQVEPLVIIAAVQLRQR